MTESLVFRIPVTSKDTENFVYDLGLNLKKVLSNDRTTIFQNSDMRLSVDKKHVRVLLFNNKNEMLLEYIREYFYGEEYKRL